MAKKQMELRGISRLDAFEARPRTKPRVSGAVGEVAEIGPKAGKNGAAAGQVTSTDAGPLLDALYNAPPPPEDMSQQAMRLARASLGLSYRAGDLVKGGSMRLDWCCKAF